MFPKNFDALYYLKCYDDLEFFNEEELVHHYKNYGINEGRICSEGQTKEFIQKIPLQFNKCLEIGPFDIPYLKGSNVKYFDVLNTDDLIDRAIDIIVN